MTTHHTQDVQTLPTGIWTLDPTQTTITITARKLGLITVPGTVAVSEGTIEIGADHQVSSVEVVADAGSYTSGNAKRDSHVRSADFLDAANHPELEFRAGNVSLTAAGYRADGSVTVKGQTFPLTVDIGKVEFDARTSTFVATGNVDRTAIGVDKFPSLFIGNDLQLTVIATAFNTEA
jgi:polyisoprenoid-binding protein YceI